MKKMPEAAPVIPAENGMSEPLRNMLHALAQRRFFKLIGGGSLTEAEKLVSVAHAYSLGAADCIDVAPELAVVEAMDSLLKGLPGCPPVLMVSLPLDPDPHFRKIDLDEPECIRCGACLPVCPTEAISLPQALEISQSLCYGCGRCVPVCPTEALYLLPFQVEAQLAAVLAHPRVEAVEIHSHYVDPYMLKALFERWGDLLAGKLISLCFRPGSIPAERILAFCQVAADCSRWPIMLQVDGAPMSGNDDPEASRPALEAAVQVAHMFRTLGQTPPPITVSGGINPHTARLLKEPGYEFIAGVGMGTVARRAVWHLSQADAAATARQIVSSFKKMG
jgi:ferredoxin